MKDEAQIMEVRAAYEALTTAQRVFVTNVAQLEQAEAALIDQKIQALIAEIGTIPEIITLEDEALIDSLMERLDALTAEQQKLVTNVDKLLDAQAQLAALKNPETGSDVPASAIILGETAFCITAISLRRRRK